MVTESERQAIIDDEHLRLLPVFYWVLGAMDIFIAMYGLIYVGMGVLISSASFPTSSTASGPPPAFISWFFVAIGLAFMLGFGVVATLKILAGSWLRKRKHRPACLVIAGLACVSIPFGTIVGVFTFLVLLRPSVAALFAPPAAAVAPVAGEAVTSAQDGTGGGQGVT